MSESELLRLKCVSDSILIFSLTRLDGAGLCLLSCGVALNRVLQHESEWAQKHFLWFQHIPPAAFHTRQVLLFIIRAFKWHLRHDLRCLIHFRLSNGISALYKGQLVFCCIKWIVLVIRCFWEKCVSLLFTLVFHLKARNYRWMGEKLTNIYHTSSVGLLHEE